MPDFKYAYSVMSLSFGAADDDYEVSWVGQRLFVDSADVDFEVKLDSRTNDAITLKAKKEIIAPFERFYISVPSACDLVLFLSNPSSIQLGGSEVNVDEIKKVEKTASASYNTVTVGAAATLVVADNDDRKAVIIQAIGGTIFVGTDNGVTIANGIQVLINQSIQFEKYTGDLYAISAAGGIDARYLEEG